MRRVGRRTELTDQITTEMMFRERAREGGLPGERWGFVII